MRDDCLPLDATAICAECGNDEAVEGYPYCTDCLEELDP